MNILICEPEYPTHYHFIQHLLPFLHKRFEQVYVCVCATADTNSHYLSTIKHFELVPNITVLKVFREPSLLPHESGFKAQEESIRIECFEQIENIINEFNIKQVIALSGDKLIPLIEKSQCNNPNSLWHQIEFYLGIHWLLPTAAKAINSQFQTTVKPIAKETKGQLAQREKLQSLFNIHPKNVLIQNFLAFRKVAAINKNPKIEFTHGPVPIEVFPPMTKKAARKELGLPVDGRIVGFSGSIQRRKGIRLFLEAMSEKSIGADTKGLLIGPFEEEISSMISTDFGSLVESGKLLLRDQVLDSRTQHLAISSFDLVICNLLEHQWSSDIALRAVVAERPIFASDGDWFQYMTTQFGLGMTIATPRTPKTVAEAVCKGLEEFSNYQSLPATQQIKLFNHPENYAKITLSAMLGKNAPELKDKSIQWPSPIGRSPIIN